MHRKKGFFFEIKKNWVLFLMLVPTLLYYVINNYLPMVGIYYAFTKFSYAGGLFGSPFVGFENFQFLIKSHVLFRITKNTILYNLAFIVAASVTQIFAAILLSRIASRIYRKVAQTIMFMPYFVSYVILGVLVYNLFNYEYGFINTFLESINAPLVDFYNSPKIWRYILVSAYLWKWIGYGTVIYLATILGVDPTLYEVAELDGANVFQQIVHITLPHIKQTFIILSLFSLGQIMKGQFELFYQIVGNNGVLFSVTDIIDTYVFRSLVTDFDIGMGTAAGLYQSVFGFIIIVSVNFLVKRRNPEYALF